VSDQATHLRRLVGHANEPRRSAPWPARRTTVTPDSSPPVHESAGPPRLAQAIAVTSGKGGVGKTNIGVNLAVCLARLGRRTCLLDGDLGLANADILCNLSPRLTLEHVISGRCRLAEAMLLAPGGFRLIPGACGVAKLADLDRTDRTALIEQLAALDHVADDLIIDTGAGLAANVLAFATAASRVLVVTTPEPTAMTDAYGMVKALTARAPDLGISLVVNMVGPEQEGEAVFDRIDRVSRTFLGRALDYGGAIPTDESVGAAIRHRVPFTLYAPDGPASAAVDALARSLLGIESSDATREGFFSRLTTWFSPGTDFRESS
jgi:flagellar biosynthesis protein FlhG